MRIRILGPVEVSSSGRPIRIETSKERALLAALAVRAPGVVSQATLVDALWGDAPPATAERTLASHVSRLRRSIGADSVRGERGSYRLDDGIDVDALRVHALIDDAADALTAGRPDIAERRTDEARSLWRSEPLLDLADGDVLRAETARLAELRRRTSETWIAAQLALGHHESVVGDIESAIADDPLHEPLWGQLMIALYRGARQADALRAFEQLRRTLRDELGIEPAPAIARIELQILRQDPRLELVEPPPPNNLPGSASSFVGRTDDISSISKTLDQHRFVTLVGPGGVGKSRLAIAVASGLLERYPDGVWWIDLAPTRDPDTVLARVAAGIGLTDPADGTLDRVVRHLERHPEALIVFDNCEHLRSTIRNLVVALLEQVPLLAILTTSRERLGVPGESRRVVTPMAIPPNSTPTEELLEFDAVRLFIDRARDVDDTTVGPNDLEAAAAICRHLDGVPLAVELAASRTIAFSPPQLAARLGARITSISRADDLSDTRYTSLDDAIAWSYDLLTPRDRQVFAQLSIFDGGFDLEAVDAVCRVGADDTEPIDALARLVDTSLVDIVSMDSANDATGRPASNQSTRRCRLLAPIREYAASRLTGTDRETLRDRHAAYFRDRTSILADTSGRLAPGAALRFRADHANFMLALDRYRHHDDIDRAFEFGLLLGTAWYALGDLEGSVRLLDDALALPTTSDRRRGWTQHQLVWPLVLLGEVDRAARSLEAAEVAADLSSDARLAAAVATTRAHALFLVVGDIEQALPLYEHALELCSPDEAPLEYVTAQLGLAQALVLSDRPDGVGEMLESAEAALGAHPDDGHRAHLCLDRALLAWCTGDLAAIQDAARHGQRHADAAGLSYWKQINSTAEGFGMLANGDLADAEITLLRAARAALDDGNLVQFGVPLQGLAALASLRGDSSTSALLLGASRATTPAWPLLERGLAASFEPAQTRAGSRFADDLGRGREIDGRDALALALAPTISSQDQ